MTYCIGAKRTSLCLVTTLATALLGNTPLKAQHTTASRGGTVTDTSRAVIPGANITVRNTGTDLTRNMQSGADGSFLFPLLPIGTYTLTVEKSDFKTYVQSGIL